jgi:hypothetical protein
MEFQFALDGVIVTDPIGWDDFIESLEWDESIRCMLVKYPSKLTFVKDGYSALNDARLTNGYCEPVVLTIKAKQTPTSEFELFFTGLIQLAACTRIIETKEYECSIVDNGYYGKIHSNKNLKAYVAVDKSKNGETIEFAPAEGVTLTRPKNNATTATRYIFDILDVLQMLVAYMTDGAMTATSDWYSNIDDKEGLGIITGHGLRVGGINATSPNISFAELITEINKKYPIGLLIDGNNVKMENIEYFQGNTTAITVSNIKDLKQFFDPERLYSSVNIGSTTAADYDISINSTPVIRMLSCSEEDYAIQGQCNIDKELNLVSDWVIDTNIIEEIVFENTSNTSYDRDVFFLQYNKDTLEASMVDVNYSYGFGKLSFNYALTNSQVIQRFNLQGNVAKYLGDGNDESSASNSADDVLYHYERVPNPSDPPAYLPHSQAIALVAFDTQISDPGSNYTNTFPYEYVCPADGLYGFSATLNYSVSAVQNTRTYLYVKFKKYDSGGVFIEEYESTSPTYAITPGGAGTDSENYIIHIYLTAGQKIRVGARFEIRHSYNGAFNPMLHHEADFKITSGGNFSCISSVNGGGVFQEETPEEYNVSGYKGSAPLTDAQWTAMLSNKIGSIDLVAEGATIPTNCKKIERNKVTGLTKFELIERV